MSDFDWVDRGRGILTKRDRKFLRGDLEEELTDNAKYQKRHQIRDRLRNAVFDFHILYRALSFQDVNLIWADIDRWIYDAETARQTGTKMEYPDIPLLAECWRDAVALFTYSQIINETTDAESLVQWVVESGINKAVRRHTFDSYNMYREVDSTLDWGVGELYKLTDYLNEIENNMPEDSHEAEDYLLDLQRDGFLRSQHVNYLHQKSVDPQ
jgi:hypothetical protein